MARKDYRDIRRYVKKKFGPQAWAQADQRLRNLLEEIGKAPLAGASPNEASNLGLSGFHQRLLDQARIIYQFDGAVVYVHMFVSTRRDLAALVVRRLLRDG